MTKPYFARLAWGSALALLLASGLTLGGCLHSGDGDDAPATDETDMMEPEVDPAIAERNAVNAAFDAAEDAIDTAYQTTATADDLDAAEAAVQAVRDAITAATNVPQHERDAFTGRVDFLESGALAGAKFAYDQRQKAAEEAEKKAAEAMAATAAKLYAGIGEAPLTATGDGQRSAEYSGTDDADITVTYDPDLTTPGDTAATIVLTADDDTMVAANHGWEGKRYADAPGGDMVEAYVYSNVEPAKQGRKFGSDAAVLPTGAYEYELNADGALPESGFVAANVAFTGVTRTAGTETFDLPDPNPNGVTIINIPGSYHGVSGTYSCTPASGTTSCSAAVAAEGFTVSDADDWTFTPSNAEARVMDTADVAYASYGWWIKKAENDGPLHRKRVP